MMNNQYIKKLVVFLLITTGFTASTAYSAECELSGMNLLQAYSRAQNNNFRMKCLSTFGTDRGFIMMPTPTGISCKHTKHADPYVLPGNYIMQLFMGPKYKLYNGWKISRFSSSGGAKKSIQSGAIRLQHNGKTHGQSFQMTVNKMWIKKSGASCKNMKAVIRDAFGD